MATLDVFKQDAFRTVSMLQPINSADYVPQRLGAMGVFTPNPIRTSDASIESLNGVLRLIQTSQRGAPIARTKKEKRSMRKFETMRIAEGGRITATELANIRAFGTESELKQVQQEIANMYAGPVGIGSSIEATLENMRLGAIQGIVKDADGAQLFDWFSEFGVTQAALIDFDLDNASPASGVLRSTCDKLVRAMMRESKGVMTSNSSITALCGDDFWDDLIAHPEIRETYLATQSAADLRNGTAFESFRFGGITWENYRGFDDGTTASIATDEARFFPVNAPGAFLEVFAPGETFADLGQLGQRIYPMIVVDEKRDMWADVEGYSYPLHIATRPAMLQRGIR